MLCQSYTAFEIDSAHFAKATCLGLVPFGQNTEAKIALAEHAVKGLFWPNPWSDQFLIHSLQLNNLSVSLKRNFFADAPSRNVTLTELDDTEPRHGLLMLDIVPWNETDQTGFEFSTDSDPPHVITGLVDNTSGTVSMFSTALVCLLMILFHMFLCLSSQLLHLC
jgi:hypothetical protein